MARVHFTLPNVTPNARVRVDSASSSAAAADIVDDRGQSVAGAILHADASGFLGAGLYGPDDGTATLYLKTLDGSGAVTATATLTATHNKLAALEARVAAIEAGAVAYPFSPTTSA